MAKYDLGGFNVSGERLNYNVVEMNHSCLK